MKSGRIFFWLIVLFVVACPALAQEVGKIMSIVGTAEVLRRERWQSVSLHEALLPGDVVRTGPGSRVAVVLADGSQIKVNANSQLLLKQVASPTRHVAMQLMRSLLRLFSGEIWVRSLGGPLEIETLAATATLRGTELNLAIEPAEATRLTVVEGVMEFRNPQGSVLVAAKEQAIAKPGEAPRKVVIINPRDAVQWALYYPPLIDYRQVIYPEGPDTQAIRRALKHYRRGALPETLRSLEQVPPERRDARFFTLRAGLLLSVSRVAEARADIAEALRRNPSEATAHALRSIIALVQNQKEEALRLARQAVELEPQSPVPQVALSYAYQATFDLEKALKSLEQAAKLAPEDALIQARLAELELSRGELERALKAARRAVALDPELARTQTVLGFAYLTQIRTGQAKSAFERAITLDSADPLPRLGLGLAKIRESNLTEGAREIEIAASLDPNNALIQSYLGKAYYEEKREELAAREFAIAKELDPKDPTPWFYEAISDQSTNRPVEALQNLQKSIALNDNRAVYRSKLLLDQDRATREASVARVYTKLGLDQLAISEAASSLSLDPASTSAHRFLVDTYSDSNRHEIGRVSELLQAQLLQPLNITPVPPSVPFTDLKFLPNVDTSAWLLSDYSQLFEKNGVRLLASGLVGGLDTFSDEVSLSALTNKLSVSAGQYYYTTDGFRTNNDLTNFIYNVFAQASPNDLFSFQAEYRQRHTEHGDIVLNFDPNEFGRQDRFEVDQDTTRFGFRLSPSPQLRVLGSLIYSRRKDNQLAFPAGEPDFDIRSVVDGTSYELQGQYVQPRFNLIAGGGYAPVDGTTSITLDFSKFGGVSCPLPSCSITDPTDIQQGNAYLYANVALLANLIATLGLGYDVFDNGSMDLRKWDPKVGLQWQPHRALQLRAAAFKTLKRSLVVEQTIEPTQIAGFSQFFDDFNGTISTTVGGAADIWFTRFLQGSVEVLERDLTVGGESLEPDSATTTTQDQSENILRMSLSWIPRRDLVVNLGYVIDDFDATPPIENLPVMVRTEAFPVGVRLFLNSGVFAGALATYVNQEVARATDPRSRTEDFVTVDLDLGYLLPQRLGAINIGVRNLFDQEFSFQDDNYRTSTYRAPVYIPARSAFVKLSLVF
jgi:tetratricopeptide (TPR) repeat protein